MLLMNKDMIMKENPSIHDSFTIILNYTWQTKKSYAMIEITPKNETFNQGVFMNTPCL